MFLLFEGGCETISVLVVESATGFYGSVIIGLVGLLVSTSEFLFGIEVGLDLISFYVSL
jgi:hypothetical protein